MGTLEFIPADRKVLRKLSRDPEEFASEFDVRLHELSQPVAEQSLVFLKSFPYETPPKWFGYLAVEDETRQMVGVCSLKGPPVEGTVEIAYFTFPEHEGRGIGTAMARFLVDRALQHEEVTRVIAHTEARHNASTRILENIGMHWAGETEDQGMPVWRWELEADRSAPAG
jgi:RimJ/RimL family protein N-acetyltransferase